MGMHPRHVRLVLDLLQQPAPPRVECAVLRNRLGAGMLLEQVRSAGFPFAGIEVSAAMQEMAVGRLGPEARRNSTWATSSTSDRQATGGLWSLVYWNDVFEHIPPDEIGEWLAQIYAMLVPGGQVADDHAELARPAFGRDRGVLSAADRLRRPAPEGIHAPRSARIAARGRVPLDRHAAGRNSRADGSLRQRRFELQVPVRACPGMAAVPSGPASQPRHGPELHDRDKVLNCRVDLAVGWAE